MGVKTVKTFRKKNLDSEIFEISSDPKAKPTFVFLDEKVA